MRHNWEYKKLGEVAEIIGGSTPKTNVKEYWDGDYFWITPAELKGDRFIKSTSRTITDLAVENTHLSLLPKGTVLLSSRAPIGKVAIADVPMYCNQGFKNIICGEKLNNNYIYWLLYGKTEYLNSLGVGATFKEISKKIVENITIPVPPLPTQQAIVSELDTLSGIIAECKETLKDYDALEQSIFYDMFGDPVKNEKGWEVKKLGEIVKDIFAGGDKPKDYSEIKTEEYCYPIIANGDGDKGILGYSTTYRVSEPAVTIGARGASIGNCRICREKFLPVVRLITIIVGDKIDVEFLYFIVGKINFGISGAGQAQLTVPNVVSEDIILPHLPLQQSFATKIEAIEQMKAETREALQEAETLFQARMDYWFN